MYLRSVCVWKRASVASVAFIVRHTVRCTQTQDCASDSQSQPRELATPNTIPNSAPALKKRKRIKITVFAGAHSFLSNFYPCRIKFAGVEFRSLEHAYQAAKTYNPWEHLRIAGMPTAKEAKQYGGRNLRPEDDWDNRRIEVMRLLIARKFKRNSDLAQQLLNTEDALLIEGNWWGDVFWGKCRGKGKNMLGKLLMRRRRKLNQYET